jgi:hypothetical protein
VSLDTGHVAAIRDFTGTRPCLIRVDAADESRAELMLAGRIEMAGPIAKRGHEIQLDHGSPLLFLSFCWISSRLEASKPCPRATIPY